MKRIIDISDRAYNEALTVKEISDIKDLTCGTRAEVFLAIKNSTPLEQEPTTKNNLGVDCVARQDVERYIEGFINEYTSTEELEFINLEFDGLKHIPSVTPQEPRKGHWDIKDNMWWVCSACGCQTRMMKKYNVPNFCPACGAKMESEET